MPGRVSAPETYTFHPTAHVPNSALPVLIYRSVLTPPAPMSDLSASTVREQVEQNGWLQGGVFKTVHAHHFHSVTHECYAVFKGRSRLLLGRGPLDDHDDHHGSGADREKVEIDLEVGDVIVLPAGVAHCSITSEGDYEYVGLYPEGSPHWDNNYCKASPEETSDKAAICRQVPVPESDPVYGRGGPLVGIWKSALAGAGDRVLE